MGSFVSDIPGLSRSNEGKEVKGQIKVKIPEVRDGRDLWHDSDTKFESENPLQNPVKSFAKKVFQI